MKSAVWAGESIDRFIPPQLRNTFYKNSNSQSKYARNNGIGAYDFPTNGLVLYLPLWALNNGGTNSIQSVDAFRHTGTITGATWHPKGRIFGGVSDVITIPHHTVFNFGTGDFSFHIWFKGIADDLDGILGKVTDGSNFFHLNRAGTTLQFQLYVADLSDLVPSTTNISGATWRLASVSRLSGTMKLYINGVEEGSVASVKSMNYTGALAVGRGYIVRFANTTIGDFWGYKRGSTTDPLQIYNASKWRY